MLDGFKSTSQNHTNRSSAIFPLFLRQNTDVRVVFLNYWEIKNKLINSTINFWIYNQSGERVMVHSFEITNSHNDFSMKALLGLESFDGMVNVEIINTSNMNFSFPAISCFYQSGDTFSAVHSSGRIKNSEEARFNSELIETNWTCKWINNLTPFFHLFNGPQRDFLDNIEVTIHSKNQDAIMKKTFDPEIAEPFASKIFFLDEIFNYEPTKIPSNSYISVKIKNCDVFPRMVVGNFHRKIDFLEVTHSFAHQFVNDYLEPVSEKEKGFVIPSINPIATNDELSLNLIFFPTNCEGNVSGRWREGKPGETVTLTDKLFEYNCGGKDSEVLNIEIPPGNKIAALDIDSGDIPTRINTNYVYKVFTAESEFSTDIAAGQIVKHFPPKMTTWGHGIIGKGYNTFLFLTAFAHDEDTRIDTKGELTIHMSHNRIYRQDFSINKDSGIFINISEIIDDDMNELEIFSWNYLQEKRTKLVAYWLSYASDGRITGDHAF